MILKLEEILKSMYAILSDLKLTADLSELPKMNAIRKDAATAINPNPENQPWCYKSYNPISVALEEKEYGKVQAKITILSSGSYYVNAVYDSNSANLDRSKGTDVITVVPLGCSTEFSEYDLSKMTGVTAGGNAEVTFFCHDKYNNNVTNGQAAITQDVRVKDSIEAIASTLVNNQNGSYTIKFSPPTAGKYLVSAFINKTELYGKIGLLQTIENPECKGDTPVRCPNNPTKCVDTIKNCLGKNDCPNDKPFFCDINGETNCVQSQKDCDCSSGSAKCDGQNFCYATALKKSICPDAQPTKCPDELPFFCLFDGICRKNVAQCPSSRVCPVGFLICPNLTCVLKGQKCPDFPDCGSNMVRCADMTCAKSLVECPSSVTCPSKKTSYMSKWKMC